MTHEKTEKEGKIRVSTKLYPNEKIYLQRLADDNARSMGSQLRFILLQTVAVDDDD